MGSLIQVYDAKVSTRTRLHILDTIRSKLATKPDRYNGFKSTVFGPWLDIKTLDHHNHLLNALLQHQRYIKDPRIDTPFVFDIGPNTLEFGRREFCLVTGFRFGKIHLDRFKKGVSKFRQRVFPELDSVQGYDLSALLDSDTKFDKLEDGDAIRVCLLFVLNHVFMGFEFRHVVSKEMFHLVEDLSAWNDFPWGQLIWQEFHKRVYNHDHRVRKKHMANMETLGSTYLPTYTLQGFVFPLKIWILETFPTSKNWWFKQDNVIPRSVAWCDVNPFIKSDYDHLFHTRLNTLIPSSDEINTSWWRYSLDYFRDPANVGTSSEQPSKKKKLHVQRKVVNREVHIKSTVVRKEVHVHHYEDEGLSVPELVKKISDMQQEFNSRMSFIEKSFNQHKTNDIPGFTLSSDHVTDFSFSGFKEHPTDRAALLNKIKEMRLDFHERLTAIEKHLKLGSCSNVEKTPFQDSKKMDKHKYFCTTSAKSTKPSPANDADKLTEEEVSLDHDEDMCLDHHEEVRLDHHEDMCLDHHEEVRLDDHEDVCVDHEEEVSLDHAKEFEKMSGKNLCPAFEQQALDETTMDSNKVVDDVVTDEGQQWLLKNLSVKLDSEELHAVESLYSLGHEKCVDKPMMDDAAGQGNNICGDEAIMDDAAGQGNNICGDEAIIDDVGIYDQLAPLSNDFSVPDQASDDDKRKGKLSKYYKSPYTIFPDSTIANPKVRAKIKRVKKMKKNNSLPLTTPDGTLIPAWTEDFVRAKNAPKNRVNVPKEIINLLFFSGDNEKYFCFPWANDGNIANNQFWKGLMGIGRERLGWLSDTHLELWVLYLLHHRPADADWAITGAYFNTLILRGDVPCCFADGVTYGLPWFAESVEKVYFPINIQDNHWVLGELHIRSGVITFYDSLPPLDFVVETRPWWLNMHKSYAQIIPKLLVSTEVMEKKNIDPTKYSISFRYAENVPRQGDAYGDCGIWVMRNMYRLINNLSLECPNTTQLGLAYREHLADFFLKYKIPYMNPSIPRT